MNRVKRLPAPDLEEVRRCFICDEDGVLYNAVKRGKLRPNTKSGSVDATGYLITNFWGTSYKTHHLVYYYHTGIWPNMLDHVNGIRTDNRLKNLKLATSTDNNRNHKMRCTNTSGVTGVSLTKKDNTWSAEIFENAKKINLGRFKNFDDAVKARREAEVRLGYTYHNNQRI